MRAIRARSSPSAPAPQAGGSGGAKVSYEEMENRGTTPRKICGLSERLSPVNRGLFPGKSVARSSRRIDPHCRAKPEAFTHGLIDLFAVAPFVRRQRHHSVMDQRRSRRDQPCLPGHRPVNRRSPPESQDRNAAGRTRKAGGSGGWSPGGLRVGARPRAQVDGRVRRLVNGFLSRRL